MSRQDLATLHVVSPCEHGNEHEIKELIAGAEFATFGCTTKAGAPRRHVVTLEKYPTTVTRR